MDSSWSGGSSQNPMESPSRSTVSRLQMHVAYVFVTAYILRDNSTSSSGMQKNNCDHTWLAIPHRDSGSG